MADGGEPGGRRDLADKPGEHIGGDRRMWLGGPLGPSRVDAVESEDRVEVNQSATLELGDFRVGQPNSAAVCLCDLVKLSAQRNDRAAPELRGVGVPDDGGVVVVTVRAQ